MKLRMQFMSSVPLVVLWADFLAYLTLCKSSTLAMTPMIIAEVHPPGNKSHREGDAVSLVCSVWNFDADLHIVSWTKRTPDTAFIVSSIEMGVPDPRYSISLQNRSSALELVFNLTISRVGPTDSGAYRCDLARKVSGGGNTFTSILRSDVELDIYPAEAFPTCSPEGKAAVDLDSELRCGATGAAVPEVAGGDGWFPVQWNGSGAEVFKDVESSDDGKTFVCTAGVVASRKNLTCRIGPLTVRMQLMNETSTTIERSPTVISPVPPGSMSSTTPPVLAAAFPLSTTVAIAASAVSVLAVVLVVINLLCCRFDPGRGRRFLRLVCGRAVPPRRDSKDGHQQAPPTGKRKSHTYERRIANPIYDEPTGGVHADTN